MQEVAKRLNLKVEFKETQWDSMFAGLNSKRFDVVANQVGKKTVKISTIFLIHIQLPKPSLSQKRTTTI